MMKSGKEKSSQVQAIVKARRRQKYQTLLELLLQTYKEYFNFLFEMKSALVILCHVGKDYHHNINLQE